MKQSNFLASLTFLLWFAWDTSAKQIEEKETIQKSFTFENKPADVKVEVDNFEGYIKVTAYDGQEVQLLINKTLLADSEERAEVARKDVRLDIAQSNNIVRCFVDGPFRCKN